MNATTPHWSLVNIGSGNGLVPSGNKPLPEPMLTQICRHMASLCHNVLRVTISPLNSQEISLMFYNAVIAISTTEHLNAAARQQTLSSYTEIHPTLNMMMSSNGNIFHVTGPLCGEFTGDWWIPSQRPVTFFLSTNEPTVEKTIVTPVISDAIALIMMSL